MEADFDSAGSSDYSLLGRIYRSKSLPDGDFSRLDDEGQEGCFVNGHQVNEWDSGVGGDFAPQEDFPSGISGVLGSEPQSCTCEDQGQPDKVKVVIGRNGKVVLNPADQKLQELRTLKQHYYPEGGWGWVVVVVACMVHMMVNGSQIVLATILVSLGKQSSVARRLHPAVFTSQSMYLVLMKALHETLNKLSSSQE